MELDDKFEPTVPNSQQDVAERLLAQAILRSGDGPDERPRGRAAETAVARPSGLGEAEVVRAVDRLYSDLRAEIQKVIAQAMAVRKETEADRVRVREELEQARAARREAERSCQQLEVEARKRAEQLIRDSLRQAEEQAAAIRHLATEEMHKMLDDTAAMCRIAQKELETQRLIATSARAGSSGPPKRSRPAAAFDPTKRNGDGNGNGNGMASFGEPGKIGDPEA